MSAWTCAACGSYNGGGTACLQCGDAPGGAAPGGDAPGGDAFTWPAYPDRPERPRAATRPAPIRGRRQAGPAAGPGRRWVAPVVLLLALITGGGGVAYAFVVRPEPTARSSTVDTPGSAGTGPTDRPTPTGATPTRAAPTRPGAVGVVTVDPAVTDLRAGAIATTLNEYFTGINTRDYDRALAVYDPAGSIDPSNPKQAAHFKAGVSTTVDSDVVLHEVLAQPGGDAVQARVTFRSRQQPGYGPGARPNETCTVWDVAYTLTRPAGSYLVFGSRGTGIPC